MRLLIVEDDLILQDGLKRTFTQSGYEVDIIADGELADFIMRNQTYDVIVLDLALPKLDGFEVLKRFRARGNQTPILILTAFDDVLNRVKGLDLGADDFLSKPFNLPELEARIRALLRRGISGKNLNITFESLIFNSENRECTSNGELILLTERETALLELLMLKSNKVVSKAKILEHLCSFNDNLSENAVEANVSRLRKKLLSYGVEIKTVRGMGYLLSGLLKGSSVESEI